MTLFNVRLGCWLGNPAAAAQSLNATLRKLLSAYPRLCPKPTYQLGSPRFSIRPPLDEAFGRTTEDNGYVYLSDGGHFENLGIYEMVRRRCKVIIVSDATCDPERTMGDLGNAIRKIRIDLNVPITLVRVNFRSSGASDQSVRYCSVGRILYSEVDDPGKSGRVSDGLLIYFKPTLTGNETVDVYHYSRESTSFPHENTINQWFSESQFESYRRLGETAAETVLGVLKDPADPAGLRARVEEYAFHGMRAIDGSGEGLGNRDKISAKAEGSGDIKAEASRTA